MPIIESSRNPKGAFDVYANLRAEAEEADLWPISRACEFFGIASRTLRVQISNGKVPAPSRMAVEGNLSLALFTKDDLLAIQYYYRSTRRDIARLLDPHKPLAQQDWNQKPPRKLANNKLDQARAEVAR